MFKSLRVAALIIGAIGTYNASRAEVVRNFKVGRWFAGEYTFNGTKRFSHCAALVNYENGVTLLFAINRNYQWSVGFLSPRFSVPPNANVTIQLSIDGEPPANVTAQAVSSTHIVVPLAPNADLFAKFRRGNMLQLIASDTTSTFKLTDTSRLLPTLLDCVRNALTPIPMQTAQAPRPTPAQAPAEDYRAEATAIVANLLSQAGIVGFRILPAGQDQLGHQADVSWTAGNLSGALLVVQDKSLESPADTAPQLIAMAAKACKGAFMSGSLPEEAHGTQARVFTNCRTDKTIRTIYYLTMRRPRGGYYVFATAADGAEEPAKEADTNIRTAVFNVLPK